MRHQYLFCVGRLHLNRQVVVLMSGLGVPNQAFFALQDNMLQQLANMLICENSAVEALSRVSYDVFRDQLRAYLLQCL